MSYLETVFDVATPQHGIFAVFQLIDRGIPRGSLDNLLKNNHFFKLDRGIFQVKSFDSTWRSRAIVEVLHCGPRALLSHESALINSGLLTEKFVSFRQRIPIPFHVTLPRSSNRRTSLSLHRSIYKHPFSRREIVNGIPQVPLEVAIIESAMHLPPSILASVIDEAIRKEMTCNQKIISALESVSPAPGRSKARVEEIIKFYLHVDNEIKNVDSALEVRVLRQIKNVFNGKIALQQAVVANRNHYRIDIALLEKKIAIEVDGFQFHRCRNIFDDDRKRQNDLVLSGWTVLRFTASQSDQEIREAISRSVGRDIPTRNS